MQRIIAALMIAGLLASCGSRADRSRHTVTRTAGGVIASACLDASQPGATRERCGCVQAVANTTLTSTDQSLGASFFRDPHRAQEIRQSSNSGNERFWQRWRAFGAEAAKICG